MLGESLEQHCEIEFNKIRPTAFPKAYFKKDSDLSEGTKGDYIYKEFDDEGNPLTRGASDVFVLSDIPEISASKTIITSFQNLQKRHHSN